MERGVVFPEVSHAAVYSVVRRPGVHEDSIAAPKAWADAYLAAFAEASQLTLVTLDRAFRGKVKPLVLLGE